MLTNAYTNDKANPFDPKIFIDVHADFPQAADRWEKLVSEKELCVEKVEYHAGTTRVVLGFRERVIQAGAPREEPDDVT